VSYGIVKVEIGLSAHKLKRMLCESRDFSDMKRLLKLLPLYVLALLLVLSVAQLSAQESELQAGDRVIVLAYRLPVYVQADTDAVVATEMTAGMVSHIITIEEDDNGQQWVYLSDGAYGWVEASLHGDATLTLFSEERLTEMIDEATSAILTNPDDPAPHLMRASIYAYQHNYEAAQPDFDRVIELKPDEAWLYEFRARFLTDSGQAAAAIEDMERAIELGADFPNTWNRLARATLYARQPAVAFQQFEDAVNRAPEYGLLYLNLGHQHYQMQAYSSAIDLYSQAFEVDPYLVTALVARGNAYYQLRNYQTAREDYDAALAIDPTCSECLMSRGIYFNDVERNFDAALSDYTLAIEADPMNSRVYSSRAITYAMTGQTDAAIDDFKQAIDLDPASEQAYYNLAALYATLGEYASAAQTYTDLINVNPDTFLGHGALLYRAQVYLAMDEFEQSDADLEEYLAGMSIFDRSVHYFFVVGWLYQARIALEQGRYEDAADLYEGAEQYDNSFTKAFHDLGMGYRITRGQEQKVIDLMTEMDDNPTAEGYLQVANLQMELGLWDDARESYEDFLELVETPPDGLEAFLLAMEGVLW
jgi:tetratricopeptide (TPR) repeat protein